MAIENPILGTQQISDMRRPDVGDPGAPYRALGKAAKTAIDVAGEAYTAKKTGELVDALEQEREEFVASNQTTPESEDVFADQLDTPDSQDIANFAAKNLKLSRAMKAGAISETELKIRQEKILREAMNARPWLADDFVRAASRTQGYNPIGSEVAAIAAAQESATAQQNKFFNEMVTQYRSLGVDMQLLFKDPARFFAQGSAAANAAFELQQATTQLDMMKTTSQLTVEEGEQFFQDEILNSKAPNALMATLPTRVYDVMSAMENLDPDVAATNPQAWANLMDRKNAIVRDFSVGGPQYLEMRREMRRHLPSMRTEDFDTMYNKYVGGFISMLDKARTGADMRAAADYYLDREWRALLIANPELNNDLHLAKAVEGLKQTAASLNLSNQLTNRISSTLAGVWRNDGVHVTPKGVRFNGDGRLGYEEDVKGNATTAEKVRETGIRAAGVLLQNGADPKNPPQMRQQSTTAGVASLFEVTSTLHRLRQEGISRPSRQQREDVLRMFATQTWADAVAGLPDAVNVNGQPQDLRRATQERAYADVSELTIDLGLDLKSRLLRNQSANLEAMPNVELVYQGGRIVARMADNVPTDNDLPAASLIGEINRAGGEIDLAFRAYKNAGGRYESGADEMFAQEFIGLLTSEW